MSDTAPATATATDAASRFVVELENAWSLLRVYGTDHPAFRRGAEAAAAAAGKPSRVSITPRGFFAGKHPVGADRLRPFATSLRAMGLIGLTVDRGLTSAQVIALVLVLHEADRTRGAADAVVDKISAATGGKVKATPLRLEGLRLVEGTADLGESARPADENVWRELFAGAFIPGGTLWPGGDVAAPAEFADAFETALRVQSPAQWEAMIGVWMRQLAAVDVSTAAGAIRAPAAASRAAGATGTVGATSGGTGHRGEPDIWSAGATPGQGRDACTHPRPTGGPALEAIASFLGALSPLLCQRLLKETIADRAVPERVVLALAERLPRGLVLGALAAVDRTNREPSAAALALLRKIAANVPGAGAAKDAALSTSAELADAASSLERLLATKNEAQYVPEEYLRRRGELSRHSLESAGHSVPYPSDSDTTRHAAGLAFQILSDPATPTSDLSSALAFVRNRVGDWTRAGDFALAREALSLASGLKAHPDAAVAKPASALASASVNSDDLLEGARHRADRARAVGELAELLRQADGVTLATLLSSVKHSGGAPTGGAGAGGGDVMLETLRTVVPTLPEATVHALFRTINATPPPALLVVLSGLRQADAMRAVQLIAPHAAGPTRRAIVHVIFRRDFRWPLALTDLLLCDDEPEIRRLAVMKLVSDSDLATAANILAAASKAGKYEADVALGLAELLRRHRHHPDVRPAWRAWTWSKRWWKALLFVNIGTPRRAA